MKTKKLLYRSLLFVFTLALALTGWQPASARSVQSVSTSGWFTVVWGDGRPGSRKTATTYHLTNDKGQTSLLSMNKALAAPFGGILALNGRRVSIKGLRIAAVNGAQAKIQVDSLTLDAQPGSADVSGQLVSGSRPFISIMCKFQDVAAEPRTLAYFKNMYSNVYPGLDNYWQEVSYLTANIAGSTAIGWVTLPHPRSYYFDGSGKLIFSYAATDCTQAVDASVNFAPYTGINLMFNANLDGYAWGGSQYMTLDGITKVWPMTWEPPFGYSDITVISHEMGHAFGLPHSSGTYGQTYDNQWDVMSDGWTTCSRSTDPTYGCLGQQTIAYHKDMLGWIPAGKKYTASGDATITLEQLALPSTSNYLMAQIAIPGTTTHFYTVEVRRQVGYDIKLPGQGVIIHDVVTTRLNPANVIDADGNGNTGDAGGIWTVGETFSDATNGISVKVLAATATGFQVAIHSPGSSSAIPIGKNIWLRANANSMYVSADQNLANVQLVANRASASGWETFTVVDAGGGLIALRASNGKYVSADTNLGAFAPLVANRTSFSGWETFQWTNAGTGQVTLKAMSTGKFVSADLNRNAYLVADRPSASGWETFTWGLTP